MLGSFDQAPARLPNEVYQNSCYGMIGLTFMNFLPDSFLPLLKKITGPSGKALLASELLSATRTADDVIRSYQNSESENFTFGPLKNLGFQREYCRYDVEFVNDRVEMGYSLLNPPEEILLRAGLPSGCRVVTAISYRYTKEKLSLLLQRYFTSHRLYESADGGTAVALCK